MTPSIHIPNLDGMGLPPQLVNAIREAFMDISAIISSSADTLSVIQDTHGNRAKLHAASKYNLGSLYIETDRMVVYANRTVGQANAWVYIAGLMFGTAANEPSDLGTNDAGFPYITSDTFQELRWSGSAWVTVLNLYAFGRLTGKTSAQASVVTYTVGSSDGSFHVSANVNITASVTFSFSVTVTYTDETNTSRTADLIFGNLGGSFFFVLANTGGAIPYTGIPFHIRAKAGTTITVATSGTFTSVTYNVEGRIAQVA